MTVFIHKGDAPLSVRQATDRGRDLYEAELAGWQRDRFMLLDQEGYAAWALAWDADNATNGANNLFNHRLHAYRAAVARLSRYRLADGRAALVEEVENGTDPETGAPIVELVEVSPAIDPLPATVTAPVIDPETGETVGETPVPNPAIVDDDTERAQAQAVIDATPQEVVEFHTAAVGV